MLEILLKMYTNDIFKMKKAPKFHRMTYTTYRTTFFLSSYYLNSTLIFSQSTLEVNIFLFRCGQCLCKCYDTLQGCDHRGAFWELLVYCGLE